MEDEPKTPVAESVVSPEQRKLFGELHPNIIAQNLIRLHQIGDIRDQADFDNIKYHIQNTIFFAQAVLMDYDGTNSDKCLHLDAVLEDLNKFVTKSQEGQSDVEVQ